ncbi:hypothetical protein Lalb_Chr03g0028661 [Lupinus albus]|uniref:Uncharacterized protein n=1 Tax=Lupinus albus TaxID=3870 RepID=A0A6A4QTH1_LUPAL|nr:hypothetical protein Lalb_Chr03g0028661 [Lupinus albus]
MLILTQEQMGLKWNSNLFSCPCFTRMYIGDRLAQPRFIFLQVVVSLENIFCSLSI